MKLICFIDPRNSTITISYHFVNKRGLSYKKFMITFFSYKAYLRKYILLNIYMNQYSLTFTSFCWSLILYISTLYLFNFQQFDCQKGLAKVGHDSAAYDLRPKVANCAMIVALYFVCFINYLQKSLHFLTILRLI